MKETDNTTNPSVEDLAQLHAQIREIIGVCKHLRVENLNLRKQTSGLMADKRNLSKVNNAARERLQIIIGRLRELESTRPSGKPS